MRETGDSLPDAGRILDLSRLFDVSTDYLLKDETEEPAPPAEKKRWGKGLLISAAITGGLGALGFLVVAVLSTMILSNVAATYIDDNGKRWYTTGVGYSFTGFVEKYRLQALLWVFGGLLAAAAILVFLWWLFRECDRE